MCAEKQLLTYISSIQDRRYESIKISNKYALILMCSRVYKAALAQQVQQESLEPQVLRVLRVLRALRAR